MRQKPTLAASSHAAAFRSVDLVAGTLGWFAAGLLGCDSSLQPAAPDDPGELLDGGVADIEVYDGPDTRRLPYTCEAPEDCNDDDICTEDDCNDGTCTYTAKSIDFSPVVIETAAPALDIAMYGGRLFVAEGEDGVEVFNIWDLEEPELDATIETEKPALAVTVISGNLIVSEGSNGIESFSVPDYELQQHVAADSSYLNGADDIYSIDLGSHYLLVSGFTDGLLLLDRSDLSAPSPVALLQTQGRAIKAASTWRTAIVADSLGGAAIVNFNGDDGPEVTEQMTTDGRAVDVDLRLYTGVVAEYGAGFRVLDLTDVTEPVQLVSYPATVPVTAVGLIGSQTLVVGDERGTLRLFDVSVQYTGREETDDNGNVTPLADAAAPELIDSWGGAGSALRFDIRNDMIAVAMSDGGAVVIDTGCYIEEEE